MRLGEDLIVQSKYLPKTYVCIGSEQTIGALTDPVPSFVTQTIENGRGEQISAKNHWQFVTIDQPKTLQSHGVVDKKTIRQSRGAPPPQEGKYISLYSDHMCFDRQR